MTETSPSAPPEVTDNRVNPPGILPRNTQAWVLAGIALLMVGVIALSGKNQPKERAPKPPTGAVIDPNTARIREYEKRIEEQAQKVRLEQAQLLQAEQGLGPTPVSPVGLTRTSGATPPPYASQAPQEDSVQSEEKKRQYRSLFASNVALTYRKEAPPSNPVPLVSMPAPELSRSLAPYGYPYPLPRIPAGTFSPPASSSQISATSSARPEGATAVRENGDDTEERSVKKTRNYAELQMAEGKEYRLFEGTVIETVLTNRLDGTFSGPVNCMVTANVYSRDGQHVLIPQGSRILGEVRKVQTFGDQRLAVFFHRLIMPDGYSASLDKFQGLSQIGETGLRDQVNHHYLQIFGASLAIGAIAGLNQINTGYGLNESAADAYRQGVTASLSQSSLHILDRFLNVLPTFTIREGHRVKIYLSDDLLLPAYENHRLPSDL